MKVTGDATLHAPVAKVWEALNDPAVLVRTIPGCQQLEETGPDAYRMTITAGVASIKGTYLGDVRLTDPDPPRSFMLRAKGSGGPGTVSADVKVSLAEAGDGSTRLDYDADAVVGGMIGGVGQRVLTGVAKKTAGEFFKAVDDVLTGKAPASAPAPAVSGGTEGEPRAAAGAPAIPAQRSGVFTAPAPASSPLTAVGSPDFMKGAALGAAVALAGVLVGALVSRRR